MADRPGRPNGPLVSLPARLARRRHIDPVTQCWEWTGSIDNKGYGRIAVDRRLTYTHRVSWELANGRPIPDGHVVDHVCENRKCFNPDHLQAITGRRNTNSRKNAQANRTHCPRGHRYEGFNLRVYVDKQGRERRICVTCNRIRSIEFRERQKSGV